MIKEINVGSSTEIAVAKEGNATNWHNHWHNHWHNCWHNHWHNCWRNHHGCPHRDK